MAVRWSLSIPPSGGLPQTTQRFEVNEAGDVTWESVTSGGDGEVNEELQPVPGTQGDRREACKGHIGPALHAKVVTAAKRALGSGCTAKAGPRQIDMGMTAMAVTFEGAMTTCTVLRTGGAYARFEEAKTEAVNRICKR